MLLVKETKEKYGYFIEDFSEFSTKLLMIQCDYCGEVIEKPISSFHIQRKKSDKDSCNNKECKGKKISETKQKLSNVPEGFRKCKQCNEIKELNSDNFNRDGKDKFKYKCKVCSKNKYNETKVLLNDTKYQLKEAIDIYENAIANSKKLLPQNFFERIDDLNGLLDYIFKNKTKMYNNKFKNFNSYFINEYKIYSLTRKYGSNYDFINHFYPNHIKPWELDVAPQGFWNDDKNKKDVLKWFVEQLINDNIVEKLKDIPKVCDYKTLAKYGLGGLVSNYFNSSPFEAMNFAYPNKFKIWEFNVPKSFYNDIENRKLIIKDFIDILMNDGYIKDEEEIPSKVNIDTFRRYGFYNFLIVSYDGVSFRAFDELYPNRWKVWEFKSCPTGFWDNKNNIKEAVIWLIDKLKFDGIIKNVKDIVNLPIHQVLKEYNLATLTNDSKKMFEYFIDTFPDILNSKMFKQNIAKDGTKCLSKPEVTIHNLLLDNGINFKYASKKVRFKNLEENEGYIPDWIVQNNIIVEYFGLFTNNQTSPVLINYREKTYRKIKFYNNLNDYKLISIFPSDLNYKMDGLLKKFSQHDINLNLANN